MRSQVPTPARHQRRTIAFAGLGIVTIGCIFLFPPNAQNAAYHAFADNRTMLGVPNFLNVISNLPFLFVGILGLRLMVDRGAVNAVREPGERWPLVAFFVGVLMTAFGSAYFHLAPDNARLVWDRLPMTVAFMGLFAAIIGERIGVRVGLGLLGPLIALGFLSVLGWYLSELRGAGDMRLYYFVQFYPILAIPFLMIAFPARYTRSSDIFAALGWYLLAKVLETETLDRGIYERGQIVSGHTLKHLAAAIGAYWIFRMVRLRRPTENNGTTDERR